MRWGEAGTKRVRLSGNAARAVESSVIAGRNLPPCFPHRASGNHHSVIDGDTGLEHIAGLHIRPALWRFAGAIVLIAEIHRLRVSSGQRSDARGFLCLLGFHLTAPPLCRCNLGIDGVQRAVASSSSRTDCWGLLVCSPGAEQAVAMVIRGSRYQRIGFSLAGTIAWQCTGCSTRSQKGLAAHRTPAPSADIAGASIALGLPGDRIRGGADGQREMKPDAVLSCGYQALACTV